MSDDLEYEIRAKLGHKVQIEGFGWCICEGTDGEGQMANDCPTVGDKK